MSQLQLAVNAHVSPRHLSFLETGRAQASREMVLRLAEYLRVPLREQNTLLLAAGFAPAYKAHAFDAPELTAVRNAAARVLENHEPFPAVALDRKRNIVLANRAAMLLNEGVAPRLLKPPVNIYRLVLDPDGLAHRIVDFADYRQHLLARLRRDADTTLDPELYALLAEVEAFPIRAGVPESSSGAENAALTLRLRDSSGQLALITTLATFGTPLDVTVGEIVIESLFPADERTAQRLRALGSARRT